MENHTGQSPREVTNVELPLVLSPWSQDSFTLMTIVCDNTANQEGSPEPWYPEFLLEFLGITDGPHD